MYTQMYIFSYVYIYIYMYIYIYIHEYEYEESGPRQAGQLYCGHSTAYTACIVTQGRRAPSPGRKGPEYNTAT